MTLTSAAAFAVSMLILAATPGPGVFAVVGRSLSSGFRKSLVLILGVVTGDLIYLIFAMTGLELVARHLENIFTFIRIAGGLYLVYIGVKTFFSPVNEDSDVQRQENAGTLSCYLSGLVITLSNPKVVLFYCGFLPVFIDLGSLSLYEGVITALIVVGVLGSVMTVYAAIAAKTGNAVRSPGGRRMLNRGSGSLMAAAGVFLAVKH